MTASEIQKNKRALDHAIAQQRLEGLTIPAEAVDDLNRVVRGEMTTATALRNAYARFAHGEVLQR